MAQLFLNRMSAPSSFDLKISISCTDLNRLSKNRCDIKRNLRCSYRKSKLAGWHVDGKNISSKKITNQN